MGFAFDGGCEFFETLFKPLERLRFDHCAELRQNPDERAASSVVNLSVPHLAINTRRHSDQTRQRRTPVQHRRNVSARMELFTKQ